MLQFGLTHAPGLIMFVMNKIFADLVDICMIIHLDSILIYSKMKSKHLEHIRKVLDRLRVKRFYGRLKKCVFGVEDEEHLDFKLRNNTLLVDSSKMQALQAWEAPECERDVQSILDMISFYRLFIKGCAKVAKPLTELTKNFPFQ